MKEDKYYIFKKIDDPKRYFGLLVDELLPPLFICLFAFFLGSLLVGLALAAIVFYLIRNFKKGQGSGWLLNFLYWHCPDWVFRVFMQGTPPSSNRHWIC